MSAICGFAGFAAPPDLLERMTRSMLHRGPDEEGFFLRERVGLGARWRIGGGGDRHRGRQPTWNQDRTVVAVLDGTVYNQRELHHALAARGHRIEDPSGAAAVVHLYQERGMALLGALRGMFGLALYDTRSGELFLARDRLGLKPLHYWQSGGKLLFGSEIKAILACDEVPREPHLESIDAYLRLGYVPGPVTMFAGVRKLPPGCSLTFRAGRTRIERYWTPAPPASPYPGDEASRERFAAILAETVRLHLASDAPVGVCLGGDVGSSLIAAAAAAERGPGVPTYAVGLPSAGRASRAVGGFATRLGCRHHQVACGPDDTALLPRIVWHLDEPLADPLVLPLFLLARAAREEVSVVVTAAGASEVLAGYRVHRILSLAESARSLFHAAFLRRFAAPLVRRLPAVLDERRRRRLGDLLDLAATGDAEAMHELLVARFDHADRRRLYLDGSALGATLYGGGTETRPPRKLPSFLDQVLALQYRTWLPDNILARQDRMAMAHGIESRAPFLDHVLVEFLLGVPPHLKLGSALGRDQVLARDYARTRLPRAVRAGRDDSLQAAGRIPDAPAFRDLVADTLAVEVVRRRGYFDPAEVTRLVAAAASRDGHAAPGQVLALVMLELWHRRFIDRPGPGAPE